jgi:hypothetical protein
MDRQLVREILNKEKSYYVDNLHRHEVFGQGRDVKAIKYHKNKIAEIDLALTEI